MKVQTAILNSSAGLAFLSAGCACNRDPLPIETQAKRDAPTATQEVASQRFASTPLVTPVFPPPKPSSPPAYDTEGPTPPHVESYPQDPFFQPLPVPPKSAGKQDPPPADTRSRDYTSGTKGRPGRTARAQGPDSWSTLQQDGRGAGPASKSARSSSHDIIGIS